MSKELGLRLLNMTRLKNFAQKKLPRGSFLRDVLLTEKNTLTPKEFLAKMDIWLKLI